MSQFIQNTIDDMKGGRQSWRVLAFFTIPSFVIAFAAAVIHRPF